MNIRLTSWVIFPSLLFSSAAFAHYPILNCQQPQNASEITCTAGFSDGSKAPGVLIEVISEEDEIVSTGHTNDNATYHFDRPEGLFFIIMDAGPGHVLEITDEDIN